MSHSQAAPRSALYWGFLALGIVLYLWPAMTAPVVEWADSQQDLEWARRGVGLSQPAPSRLTAADSVRPVKPLYLFFLRLVSAVPGAPDTRAIVIAQSLLVSIALGFFVWTLGKHVPMEIAFAVGLILLFFLRTRDSSSAIMSEALATALFLGLAGPLLFPPRTTWGIALLGSATGVLFWVRPNVGACALLLAIVRLLKEKRLRAALLVAIGFGVVFLPIEIASRPVAGEPTRGLAYTIREASADYFWTPALGQRPEGARVGRVELAEAASNWKRILSSLDADARRQLRWRALHGFFGVEYYDARWSEPYWWLTTASRLLSPFLVMISLVVLLLAPFQGADRPLNSLAFALVAFLVVQSLVVGSLPRFMLPFLPVLLALGALGLSQVSRAPRWKKVTGLMIACVLCGVLAQSRGALVWEWGAVEKAGVTLVQRIPAGSLPFGAPATLHVRIAPPSSQSSAHLEVFGPGGYRLYSSRDQKSRHRPELTIPLPAWLLAMNRTGAIELSFVSSGEYTPHELLLFPVVPPPWGAAAVRVSDPRLSPATGVAWGSLDWWAHSGGDAAPVTALD